MGNRVSSQSLILVGCTLFVLYLAGVPLVMLLYGSIRSAPIGEPGATYTIQAVVSGYNGSNSSGVVYLPNWN